MRRIVFRREVFVDADGPRAVALGAVELTRSPVGFQLAVLDATGAGVRVHCGKGGLMSLADALVKAALLNGEGP